ncbi:MAG: Crp/Fnr family transcriptional regulator [Pseudomonadota bacterium]|nr:Crp/Fnr family transcriptional regulator [Pseudomonadota bacterium]
MHDLLAITLKRLEGASVGDRDALAALIGEGRAVSAGRVLVEEGSRPQLSMLLLSGFVGRVSILDEGGRQISGLNVPGDFVDLHSLLLKKMDHSLVALTEVVVATISHVNIRFICEARPQLMRALWRETVVDGAINREWLLTLGRMPAAERLAHLFCELYVRLEAVGLAADYRFDLPLTQSDAADMLGITPVHVNRSLKTLRERGLLEWRGGPAIIHDWHALARLAQFDPTYLQARLTTSPV